MVITTSTRRTTSALRWAPVVSATYAQATSFASAAVLAFLVTDVAADFTAPSAARLWPLGALALGMVAAANTARRAGAIGPARYTGSAALAGLTASAFATALAPNFTFLIIAAFALGVSGGLAVAIAGRVLAAAEVGDGSASVVLSAVALLVGIVGGVGSLFVVPALGWRGAMGLVVVAAVMATWKFAEHTPNE
jgi:MFS family permease